MRSKSKKESYIDFTLNDYQSKKIEYLANESGVTPQFIIYELEHIISQLIEGKSGKEFMEMLNCVKIEKLKKDIEKKKREIKEIQQQITELDKRLKEYEDDYVAIIELSKALDNLLKINRGDNGGI